MYSTLDTLKAWKTFHNLLKLLLYTGNGVGVPMWSKPTHDITRCSFVFSFVASFQLVFSFVFAFCNFSFLDICKFKTPDPSPDPGQVQLEGL